MSRFGEGPRAATLFAVAGIAYLWPVLFGGKALLGGAVAGNPILSDIPQVIQPWLGYARDLIHDGTLPAWNPFSLSGTPFLSNGQAQVLSPFAPPVWLLSFRLGLGVMALVKLWVAAFGTYMLVRRLGLSFWAGLVSGLGYGFLPFTIVWLQFPHSSVWAVLPLMLWAVEGLARHGERRDAGWLALAAAAAFASGHVESAAHVVGAVALYALLRIGLGEYGERLRRLGLTAVGGIAGALLAGVTLLPTALNLRDASWVEGREHMGDFHLPFTSAHTLLFPDWWGRPDGIELPGAPINFNEGTMYAGAVVLVLALAALTRTEGWRRKLPFLAFAVIGFEATLGWPPVYWLTKTLPPFDHATNTRLIWLLGLGAAVLAGFAVDQIREREKPWRELGVAGAAVAAGLVAVISIGPSGDVLRSVGDHFRTGTDFSIPEVIRTTSVAWWLLLAGGVAVAIALRRKAPAWIVAALLLALVALDLGHFSHGYNPMADAALLINPNPPDARFPDGSSNGRAHLVGAHPDAQLPGRLRDARGYDPPMPRLRYFHLWQRAIPASALDFPLDAPRPTTPVQRRLQRLLAVQWYVTPDGKATKDRGAPARAFVPSSVRPVNGEAQALAAVYAPGFDPRTDAVVEGGSAAAGAGRAAVTRDENARVDVQAKLDRPGLVVLADTLDDGWDVQVDGRDGKVLRVNDVLRGVQVPAGAHTVSWRYTVPGLIPGAILTLIGLAATGFLLSRRRRATPS